MPSSAPEVTPDAQVAAALTGDKRALEGLVHRVQGRIYNLAVRFLFEPVDAEDATQEILIRIITRLSSFRGGSKFETWAYRVATNYLLNVKRGSYENLSFDEGYHYLGEGMKEPTYTGTDSALLEQEIKLICTTSMLICLSRPLRLAYLLGELLEFDSEEGAYILEIERATFRKRLSLARKKIRDFMGRQCGLYDSQNPCRCSKQITYNLNIKMITPGQHRFASSDEVSYRTEQVDRFMDEVAIFHSQPQYSTPKAVLEAVRGLIGGLTTGLE
jgi:RNA polymerase sigma factor (sigma-70 family)